MEIFGRDYHQPKQHLQGTHRSRSPEETLRLWAPWMERFGITRLANVTGLDFVGIPVYMAVRPLSRALSVSQGKGVDNASAKASALMESIEVWHAERVELPLRLESFNALRRHETVLEMAEIPVYPDRVFDPNRPMLWCRGHDLMQQEELWIPLACASLSSVRPYLGAKRIVAQHSNGLASGNHLLEAILHGLCEVVERDASTLWHSDPHDISGKQSQIDPTSVHDSTCRTVLDKLAAAGLIVGMYDVTSDIGVPAYQAVIFEPPGTPRAMGYFWGYGCHPAPEVALARALTEAAQCRLTEIAGSREDISEEAAELGRDEGDLQEMADLVANPPPPRRFESRESVATETFEGDVEIILERLRRAGLSRAVVADLTRPDVGIPVVKVIVPGLESFFNSQHYRPGKRAQAFTSREMTVAAE